MSRIRPAPVTEAGKAIHELLEASSLAQRSQKSERQKVLAQLEYALRELAQVPCAPNCPLAAKPYPSGPGGCARCKAHGALWNLREDLSRQERLEAGRRDAHESRRQGR